MTPYVLALDQITAEDGPLVGSKAFHLSELRRAGLPVPPGFVVTTKAYDHFAAANGLVGPAVWAQCTQDSELPEEIERAVAGAYHTLYSRIAACPNRGTSEESSTVSLAVRSSATAEDMAQASFAGQYETYLHLTSLAEILRSVKACWHSLWSERAQAYRRANRIPSDGLAMAVLIQQQVPADVSGVLFTLDPSTGRERHMAIEAVWGLGEGLVSGRVTPDHYVVDAWDERILTRQIADKATMVVAREGAGVHSVEVPEWKRREPCLDDPQLIELTNLGYAVQGVYGYPQDIEWAWWNGQFHILQSRPLTSFTFDSEFGQWSSANLQEALPGFVSVLSQSLSGEHEWTEAMEEMFGRLKMMRPRRHDDAHWTALIFGRAYWNVGLAKDYAAQVPGFEERAFDRTMGIEPTYEGRGRTTGFGVWTILRALPVLLALKRTYRQVLKEAETYCRDFRRQEPSFSSVFPQELGDEQLRNEVKRVLDLRSNANRLAIVTATLATFSQDDFQPMVDQLNTDYPGRRPIVMGRLLTGLSNVGTVEPLVGLWRISRQAQSHPSLVEAIRHTPVEELRQRLEGFPQGRTFLYSLDGYVHAFRYMSASDEDLAYPRWDEDDSFVLRTLKNFIAQGDEESFETRIQLQKRIRELERQRAMARLRHGWLRLAPWRRASFDSQLELVKTFCWWREETRVVASRAFYYCRRVLGEQGRRWADQGVLEQPDDIFWMERRHLLSLLEGSEKPSAVREVVRKHRRTTSIYRNFAAPATISARGGPPEPSQQATGLRFTGVACGSGRVTARAKVVRSLAEADKLKRGDILVAPYTNPGWTPLFSLASGIIMEEGGLLSHGAVVARECGIPTVLQIKGAVHVFRDGQLLCVDGDRGVVEIIEA